jgi:hypothetical protein
MLSKKKQTNYMDKEKIEIQRSYSKHYYVGKTWGITGLPKGR